MVERESNKFVRRSRRRSFCVKFYSGCRVWRDDTSAVVTYVRSPRSFPGNPSYERFGEAGPISPWGGATLLRDTTMMNDHCICRVQPEKVAQHLMGLPATALTPENSTQVPEAAGLYAIHRTSTGECLWVGRTDNLRDRIFVQHYKLGRDDKSNSDLVRVVQQNIFGSTDVTTRLHAQQWIRDNCVVRWLVLRRRTNCGGS